MTQFDLKATLKRICPQLRQELFSQWPSHAGLDWSQMQEKRAVDPLFEWLQALHPEMKREINTLLRTFENLNTATGLKVLLEELEYLAPELVQEWGAIENRMDKVVWTYLKAKKIFEEVIIFARADYLSTKRYWHKWCKVKHDDFVASEERCNALSDELIEHYSDEFRGDKCKIHHYSRTNGAEYFFAYLPDWPDNFMVFNRDGELESLDLPTAFSILFVFTPTTGVLEMIATGGKDTQLQLRRRFYKAMTKTDVDDDPHDRPAYELDHILSDEFAFAGHDTSRVESVCVTRILIFPSVDANYIEGLQSRFARGTPWRRAREQVTLLLESIDLDRSQVVVEEVCIRIKCIGDGRRAGRVLTIRVTPRACDLKSVDDEHLRVLGERCLQAWRIDPD